MLEPLSQASDLARQALYLSNPNPRVGCVLTDPSGQVMGHGHTSQAGGPHAEVMALRDAWSRGHNTQGASAFVTLEPCSHHGRTPPCCDALIGAGIARVVVAQTDPNPLVAGQGLQRLREAGMQVLVLESDHELARASRELNIGFFSRMIRKQPWVRMKAALSLDGASALANGQSQWITGEAARNDGHAWRARACAVLTGIGTVLQDDPMLDVRALDTQRQPHLVIVDSRLQTPPTARLFAPAAQGLKRDILIYTAAENPEVSARLQAQGAQVLAMPAAHGKVDLAAMLQDLGRREINELHLEAGHQLNGSFLRESLVDELLIYMAAQLLGSGSTGLSSWGPLHSLEQRLALRFVHTQMLGEDLRMLARVQGRDSFLDTATAL